MKESYDIVLEGQLGERRGRLEWDESDGAVHGRLSLLGFDNVLTGERNGGILHLTHELRTHVGRLACRSTIALQGERLYGAVVTGSASLPLRGERVYENAEDPNEVSK